MSERDENMTAKRQRDLLLKTCREALDHLLHIQAHRGMIEDSELDYLRDAIARVEPTKGPQ